MRITTDLINRSVKEFFCLTDPWHNTWYDYDWLVFYSVRHVISYINRLEVNNQNYALYEVGGNIHERCLEPNTFISSLLRENPEATWYIKQRKDS